MTTENQRSYKIELEVNNQPGVLVRCAQVFGRRGHNIESLKVSPTDDDHDRSIMVIEAFGSEETIKQISLQLQKLVDIISVDVSH